MIIDCNMNLPLLYWASEQTGDPRYAQAATAHAQQAARYIVREDASTYHTYYIDVNTGEPRFGNTHQAIATPPAGPAARHGASTASCSAIAIPVIKIWWSCRAVWPTTS